MKYSIGVIPCVRDVICQGKGLPFVVVSINDCRAICVALRNRDWKDKEATITVGEPTFGISPMSEIDGKWARVLGHFCGVIEERKSMTFDRNRHDREEIILMPMPGHATPSKKPRRSRPVGVEIPDTGLPTAHNPKSSLDVMKTAASKLNAIVSGHIS